MTRQESIEAGQKTYNGKVCKTCNNTEKYVTSYGCVTCTLNRSNTNTDYIRAYSKTDKAKQRSKKYMATYENKDAVNRKWRSKDATKSKVKQYYKDNTDMWSESSLKRLYGITLQDYNSLLLEQNNCCAICDKHKDEHNGKLHVDHCHTTGRIRGILCHNCNTGLGHFKESEAIMIKAMRYLK